MPEPAATPDPSQQLQRLPDDTLADRVERLFQAFPNPATNKPYTNAEAAAAITAAGTPIHYRTIENLRSKNSKSRPSAETVESVSNLFGGIDTDFFYPGSVADQRKREQAEAEAAGGPGEAELAAISKLFASPEWYLKAGELGERLDAELELFIAMRDEDVRAVAMRYGKADPATKRLIARTLRIGARKRTERASRRESDQEAGDGR